MIGTHKFKTMDKEVHNVLEQLRNSLLAMSYKRESYKSVPDNEIEFMVDTLKRGDMTLRQLELQYQSIVDEINNVRSKIDCEVDTLEEVLTNRIANRNK